MPEQHRRSIVKGLTWRVLGTSDTILLSFIFTGSLTAALSIGGLELVTKTLWYYAHERAWLHVGTPHKHPKLAKLFGQNAHLRSISKAVSWRVVGALDTFLIALIITGHLAISSSIGATELVTKVVLYYLHERLWLHIRWGTHHPEALRGLPHEREFPDVRAAVEDVRRYYHLGAAVFYGVLCIACVLIFAGIVYTLHSTL